MTWFNILKNEMRSINLPKFKVKPFNLNKPDEEDNDCKDRFLNEVWKKSEQTKLIHNNPKGSIQSLFDDIEKMAEQGGFVFRMGDSITDDDDLYYATLNLYPTLSDGFADPDTFVEVRIIEDNDQDKEQDVNEIPEEVYCKALDMISQGSPQRYGTYVEESVGDWKIKYKNIDRVMEESLGIRLIKRRVITIKKGGVNYITLWNTVRVRTTNFGDYVERVKMLPKWFNGISAALIKIERHFEDIKIEW